MDSERYVISTDEKLWTVNGMINPQNDRVQAKTNANQKFKEENFNRFTSVLHRYRGKHPLYFGAKWDDFWWVERFWAILCNEVYREPRPKTIKKVMRRVREASVNVSEKTLIKLVHQSPARMHEIFKQKGGRIPARWNYKKSPYACTCKICTE